MSTNPRFYNTSLVYAWLNKFEVLLSDGFSYGLRLSPTLIGSVSKACQLCLQKEMQNLMVLRHPHCCHCSPAIFMALLDFFGGLLQFPLLLLFPTIVSSQLSIWKEPLNCESRHVPPLLQVLRWLPFCSRAKSGPPKDTS